MGPPVVSVRRFDADSAVCGPADVPALAARFGIFDLEKSTRRVLDHERDPARRFALMAMSPEFSVT